MWRRIHKLTESIVQARYCTGTKQAFATLHRTPPITHRPTPNSVRQHSTAHVTCSFLQPYSLTIHLTQLIVYFLILFMSSKYILSLSRTQLLMSSDCTHSHEPLAPGQKLVRDETYQSKGVGVVQEATPDAVKIQKVRANDQERVNYASHHGSMNLTKSFWFYFPIQIVFLGTGSAIPSPGRRNTSAIAMTFNNASTVLLDCGQFTVLSNGNRWPC